MHCLASAPGFWVVDHSLFYGAVVWCMCGCRGERGEAMYSTVMGSFTQCLIWPSIPNLRYKRREELGERKEEQEEEPETIGGPLCGYKGRSV